MHQMDGQHWRGHGQGPLLLCALMRGWTRQIGEQTQGEDEAEEVEMRPFGRRSPHAIYGMGGFVFLTNWNWKKAFKINQHLPYGQAPLRGSRSFFNRILI